MKPDKVPPIIEALKDASRPERHMFRDVLMRLMDAKVMLYEDSPPSSNSSATQKRFAPACERPTRKP